MITPDLWIRCPHPVPDADLRLVCLPHAGGSASYYFPLSTLLTPRVEVLAVQYPGRQDRRQEPYVDNIAELADLVTVALEPWTGQPYAIFGHSLGAVLGFEVVRRLEAAGTTGRGPVRLFASGRRGPSTHRDEQVHLRDDPGVIAELRQLSGTDQRFLEDEELLAMILPVTRNDYRAVETYECADGARLACPISVLVGDSDPKTTVDEARAWADHTTGGFDIEVYPGGHFYLETHRVAVANHIQAALATPSTGTSAPTGRPV